MELALPISKIFNNISKKQIYPSHWKTEHGVPIPKVYPPESEGDLRIISKTAFLSKLYEGFVCKWLAPILEKHLDPAQCGIKGLSITHYLIRFLHFIQSSLDSQTPTAVIAAYIDMSKAFNRVDHTLLVSDLYEMKCPAWLLRIVISFLTNRELLLNYDGKIAKTRRLPGGAPAGSLLGGILFIVKFNGVILRPNIPRPLALKPSSHHHEKYMDDASTAVIVRLKNDLISDPVLREKPLNYSERTQQILPKDKKMLQHFPEDIEA